MNYRRVVAVMLAIAAVSPAFADVERRTTNDGNLVMEDVPEIPARIVNGLNRYQNVRAARFRAWTGDGDGVYVTTRFGDVDQLHRVDMPGGARHQLTFYKEPIDDIARAPDGERLLFTRDAGGSEFSQVFLFDPATNEARMLTDGESRNDAVVWDRDGRRIAYQSTRRNGASNDIWVMEPDDPGGARTVLESPDGTWWGAADFSAGGNELLALNYVSIADSRVHLIDLDSGDATLLAGGADRISTNYPLAFDAEGAGFWLITSQGGDFERLAWQSFAPGSAPQILTGDIPWNVTDATLSDDRRRLAFAVNEDGQSSVYLMDTRSREYRKIDDLPTGVVGDLGFRPDGRALAMTLNTASTPSDTFVLELGRSPLRYGDLVRWTSSEIGGLDPARLRDPELVHYPTFDRDDDGSRMIPAWVYKPAGPGPHPVIIAIHGGPEGQARPTFSSTYQMWLAELGAAVIRPNVRGSDGYGKSYLALDNGMKREDSVRDIGALLDWIESQPDLDASRVAVFGGSYGGYMVLASAVHYSDRLQAAVDVVGISNFVTFLENTQDYRRDLRRVEYGDERDPAMRAHLQAISPLNNVNRISIPMFVVQGENDPRVPVTEADQMVEALREQENIVWYMNALNEGHGYRKKENRDIYQQATVLFFEKHLLGDG